MLSCIFEFGPGDIALSSLSMSARYFRVSCFGIEEAMQLSVLCASVFCCKTGDKALVMAGSNLICGVERSQKAGYVSLT